MSEERNLTPVKPRIEYLDFLRVFAVFFVVLIHTIYQSFNSVAVEQWQWQTLNVYDSFSRWAVPVFVMISGALFLESKKRFSAILSKNVVRLVAAFVIWTVIYALLTQYYFHNDNSTLNALLKGHYHMWFILMMIGLYLVTPILRKIVQEKSLMKLFLVLALIFAFFLPDLRRILDMFQGDSIKMFSGALSSWIDNSKMNLPLGYTGYFVLGYCLNKYEISKKLEYIIYGLGVVGVAFTTIATSLRSLELHSAYVGFYEYITLNTAMAAAAVFVFFKQHYHVKDHDSRYCRVIRALSKYSFGVYLVHLALLEYANYKLHITPMSFNPIISTPLICLAVTIISFAISAILNNIPIVKKFMV